MEYLVENMLVKNITYKQTSNVNPKLLDILTPNEFYIYTYLMHAPDDFVPTQEKVGELLGLRSRTSVREVVNRLKQLGLLEINRMSNVYVWVISDVYVAPEHDVLSPVKVSKEEDREQINLEIAQIEAALDIAESPEEMDKLFERRLELKMKLRRKK